MESILLGALAMTGFNSTGKNKDKKKLKKPKIEPRYKSDIESNMNKLEKKQAHQLKNTPEYFKQFDELTFDNINEPVAISDAHITITGLDSGLQKNLNLYNGYSNVQDDLNYQVITRENFTHNNMTPNTSKRDYTIDDSRATRKLEAFTGVNENWVPKQEKYPLFEPMKNLSYVNGMPVFTDYMDDRYLPSSKNNNGNLPFSNNVFVKPGLDGENRKGLGTVYRVNPRSTDALRSENNPKISYLNKPLETIRKGEMRGPDFNLTKYKLPDFRETKFSDLVANKAEITGRIKTGKFTNVTTQRNETDIYLPGHANNPNMGDGPAKSKTKFEPTKRQELYNDPTHAINAVDQRPVFTNVESFANRENQRTTTNASQNGTVSFSSGGNWTAWEDKARKTVRESTSHNVILGSQPENSGPGAQFNDKARKTIREGTSHNITLGSQPENSGPGAQITDKARKTIRESTSHNITLGSQPENSGPGAQITDKARKTIRESTSHNLTLGAQPENSGPGAQITDKAKKTIRENTSHNIILGSQPENTGPGAQLADKARKTIRENTSHNLTLGAQPENTGPGAQYTDQARNTIRQNTSHNLTLGAQPENAGPGAQYADEARKTIREGTSHNLILGAQGENTGPNAEFSDKAKPTIRQTTLYQTPGMNVASTVVATYAKDVQDVARNTIRQTTENNQYEGPLYGVDNYAGYARDAKDKARTTVKETTLLTDYKGGLSWVVDRPSSHIAADNMTIRDTREISTYNRTAAGGKNKGGPQINRDTVKTNCRKESVYYVSHPSRPLDQSVMPSSTDAYKNKCLENKKPQLTYGNYYTNNVYINTLNDNPYVNDLKHQKNYEFSSIN